MKTSPFAFVLCSVLLACTPTPSAPTPTSTPAADPPTAAPTSTETSTLPAQVNNVLTVTNTADSGPGSLRQALEDAQPFAVITFDSSVFPHDAPATIAVESELPHIRVSNLTVDASDFGVILDGSQIGGDWVAGLQIVEADSNTIRGLQIAHFPGPGIAISGDSSDNVIGGDRSMGVGPFGGGNLFSNNVHGIDISTPDTTLNTITGNLIGSDASGTAGLGNDTGIWITEGAHDNIIGPDNFIVDNNEYGIVVEGSDTLRNTITQNSITGHSYRDIVLKANGNARLAAPIIFNFDLAAGALDGITCADCTVEIFSDESSGGAAFEAQATANGQGEFIVNTGSALIGPNLTATATDPDGNTSGFSLATTGSSRSVSMQLGNNLPRSLLLAKPSNELDDNRIATQFDSFALPEEFYDLGIYGSGVTRARVAITGIEPELVNWDIPEFYIEPVHDDVFTRMADNGLIITYMLTFWDMETYPGGEGAPCARFKTEEEIEHYLEFVRFTVDHFKDRVQYYEIWNEPDIEEYCPKWIEAEDYIKLVERTVPVIREVYPEAKIVVGSVSNTAFPGAWEYLMEVLNSEIMPLVDVVAWHPMYGTSPEYELYRDYYYDYPNLVQRIKETAADHGFVGEFRADEIGWATPYNAVPDQPWVYSHIAANKYLSRAVIMHLGLDVGVGLGSDSLVVPNLCTVMEGAEPASLPVKIDSRAEDIVSYTFMYPNGNKMVALWTDGVAADNDPGVEATLILPGYAASEAVGIDTLYGFEQELMVETAGGDTIISHLLVRDYPILIRVNGAES